MRRPKPLESRVLFFTTSPRTPSKMIPEIQLLERFEGRVWNGECQLEYAKALRDEDFFNGTGENDPAFSARDRINRAPKALGFVILDPVISITQPGEDYISEKRNEDVLLRQLLKFQVPSVYHRISDKIDTDFWVKPYLEILRLIYELGTLTFEELRMFGLQLTDYHKFDSIAFDILEYRKKRSLQQNKKKYDALTLENVVRKIYSNEIKEGKTKTRESKEFSESNFIKTKMNNMRDYADSCVRYLRSTGLISISHGINSTLSILPSRIKDVEFILNTVSRDPVFVEDSERYLSYLSDPSIPQLYSDDIENLIDSILRISDYSRNELLGRTHSDLLDIKDTIVFNNRNAIITKELESLRSYQAYQSVIDTFNNINDEYDSALMLEWNVWRAMAMLDDGEIKGNFKLDDEGMPMATAGGNMPDIECDYDSFALSVEVTMSGGQRQYETEGESVSRHLGQFKKKMGKDTYCLFVAPKISPAVISYFYMLHKTKIEYYGGTSVIVPMELDVFRSMIENAYASQVNGNRPTSKDIQFLFEHSIDVAQSSNDENEWYNEMVITARNWMKL